MATETEQLVVQLEARIRDFEKNFQRANRVANDNWTKIERRGDQAVKKLQSVNASIGSILGTIGVGFGSAQAFKAVSTAAQQFTDLQNALKVTGLEGAKLDKTFQSLFQIAQKNGTEIAPLVSLFSRASQAQKELNASSQDLLKFTDGVSTSLRVAGTSTEAASGALLQLGQLLGSGKVQAEEFNSVNEGARPILQAVAAGLEEAGGSVAKLKTLVNDGKVSSEAFFRAFLAGMPQVEAQAAKADATVTQATNQISNAFILLVGHLDKASGASSNAATNLAALGGVLERMPGYFDAAIKKLQEFQSWLSKAGTSDVWTRIAKFMGADLSAETAESLAAKGITTVAPPSSAGGRIAEGANDPTGRAPAPPEIKPVSLRDYKVPGAKDKAESETAFERATNSVQRRTELLRAETETIDQGSAARGRARIMVELETAARRTNEEQGKKNTAVTKEQKEEIDKLADAYVAQAQKMEALNAPLARLARQSADLKQQLQDAAVQGLGSLEDGLVDVITGTKSVQEAFADMAKSILNDLLRIAIRQAIIGPLASGLTGGVGGGGGLLSGLGGLLGFADGGAVRGPGTGTSDSIPAMLSNGEYVVRASAAAQHHDLLDAINSGRVARFAEGGQVSGEGASAPSPASSSEGAVPSSETATPVTINSTLQFNFASAGQANDVDPTKAPAFAKAVEGQLNAFIESKVGEVLLRQSRAGGVLRRR